MALSKTSKYAIMFIPALIIKTLDVTFSIIYIPLYITSEALQAIDRAMINWLEEE